MMAPNTSTNLICEQCAYITELQLNLQNHTSLQHEIFGHDCEICSFKSGGKNSLSMHIRSKHEGTKRANKEGLPKRAQNRAFETADQKDFKEITKQNEGF